ncbi:K(+)-transporting ATPase subunit C [Flavihumibacter rivuli]|uniref:K(+)-transporting ATPase subunit C n=1 Tax=Flavihumibacter rivuli TaxID=2838156 RepID=UPI001BDEE3C3|nr:K(+)-transporting ATPase subunit C [Flavihumibacter rivuli]ULQ55097.1 K(+)-transporting ATPase subunit C [Flavihumibacter rivuli]
MKENIIKAIKLTFILVVIFSGVYTMVIWAIAQAAPGRGEGRKVLINGKLAGYAGVGQTFTADHYFQGRPSAVDYNAAGSAGSNSGPSNPDYLRLVESRIDTFLVHNPGVERSSVPVELVTASGSGLDPDISPAAAMVQVARVARQRNMPIGKLEALVSEQTRGPLLGIFGPATINVLALNLALDQLNPVDSTK